MLSHFTSLVSVQYVWFDVLSIFIVWHIQLANVRVCARHNNTPDFIHSNVHSAIFVTMWARMQLVCVKLSYNRGVERDGECFNGNVWMETARNLFESVRLNRTLYLVTHRNTFCSLTMFNLFTFGKIHSVIWKREYVLLCLIKSYKFIQNVCIKWMVYMKIVSTVSTKLGPIVEWIKIKYDKWK